MDEALRLTPVYAAANILANSVASLPLKMYLNTGGGKTRRWEGPSIFDKPSPAGTIYDWLFTCMTSLVLQGNAWGYVLGRDGYGYPTGIEWVQPEYVTVIDDETQPYNPLRSRIYYYGRLMSREEIFHIKAFSLPGRTEGISPLRAFAITILNGLEATRYGTDWFAAGGFPPGTFKNNEIEIDPEQSAEIRGMLNSAIRRREPLVYGRDWDYHPVTVPPSEAQFIEAMQLNATQIAAVYSLPPDRVGGKKGDSLTYSTVEQAAIQIITEALRPWLVRLETAFFDIIPSGRFVRFNPDALLKTDLATRANIYKVQRDIGMLTVDEIRDREDMTPLPDGVGSDPLPLLAEIAMARSVRAMPKVYMPQVTLEAEIELGILEKLNVAFPPVPAPAQGAGGPFGQQSAPVGPGQSAPQPPLRILSPQQYLVNQLVAVRDQLPELEQAAGCTFTAIRALLDSLEQAGSVAGGHAREAPEYLGPWIPDERAFARNGNGREASHGTAG